MLEQIEQALGEKLSIELLEHYENQKVKGEI